MPPLGGDHYDGLSRGDRIAMHATVMYRRAAFDAVGSFDPSLKACEDYDLYLRVARRFPICSYDETVAQYRQHGAQMTRDAMLMLDASVAVLRSQWEYVRWDERYKTSYKTGLVFWREWYGR